MPQKEVQSVHGTIRENPDGTLTVTVQRKRGPHAETYRPEFLPSDPDIGAPAWRMTKVGLFDSDVRDVIVTPDGPVCDCPDFENRRRNRDPDGCKHIIALRLTGRLESDR